MQLIITMISCIFHLMRELFNFFLMITNNKTSSISNQLYFIYCINLRDTFTQITPINSRVLLLGFWQDSNLQHLFASKISGFREKMLRSATLPDYLRWQRKIESQQSIYKLLEITWIYQAKVFDYAVCNRLNSMSTAKENIFNFDLKGLIGNFACSSSLPNC